MEADNGPTNVAALPAAGKYMLNQKKKKKEKQRKIIPFDWSVIFVKGGRRVLCSYINSAHLARKLRNCWCRRKFFFFFVSCSRRSIFQCVCNMFFPTNFCVNHLCVYGPWVYIGRIRVCILYRLLCGVWVWCDRAARHVKLYKCTVHVCNFVLYSSG